jgi:dTMP kinase
MFITFEGIDFSGKSTQIALLRQRLEDVGRETLIVREPGGTAISEHIRALLLDPSVENMDPVSEFLLFSASRSQLVREVILPALDRGMLVIADRFFDSSTAYQGYGRGLNLDDLLRVHHLASHGITPDLTLFIDIPVAESFVRRARRSGDIDRMERADEDFYQRVRDGYLQIASSSHDRFLVLDGERPIEDIAAQIWNVVDARLHSSDRSSTGGEK